jgi:hypothetical protein
MRGLLRILGPVMMLLGFVCSAATWGSEGGTRPGVSTWLVNGPCVWIFVVGLAVSIACVKLKI